jgi:hypothetical protein
MASRRNSPHTYVLARLLAMLTCILAAMLASASGVALAAAPETPRTLEVETFTGTTATLRGILNPEHAGEAGSYYEFRYWPSATECEHAGNWESGSGGSAAGAQAETVEAKLRELQPGRSYSFCLRVVNEAGEAAESAPRAFATPVAPPTVSREKVLEAGLQEVVLGAEINTGASPTGFYVEYGPTAAYGSRTPTVDVGGGYETSPVQVRLGGLAANAEYHYRFVASNELGQADGEAEIFGTGVSLGASTAVLADDRVYELVSSPTANQNVAVPDGGSHGSSTKPNEDEPAYQPFRAASDGGSLIYPGSPDLEGGNGAFGDSQANEWMSTRTAAGWTAVDITPPGTDTNAEYSLFSSDLSVGMFHADNGTSIASSPLSPECRWNMYSRTLDGSYHALITHPDTAGECGYPNAPDISADGSNLLFEDEARLTAGAQEAPSGQSENIYDSAGGVLHQVNVLPDGAPEAEPHAWLGAAPSDGNAPPNFSNAVSPDGSRIFWSSVEGKGEHNIPKMLYVRENVTQPQSPLGAGGECAISADACTVEVDAGEAQCVARGECESGGGLFWTASADGSKVLFTDERRLTANSTAAPGEPDLYADAVNSEDGKPGTVTDLTAAAAGHADVQGVIGASEDGSYVYFVADGVLTHGPNVEGHEPEPEAPNLYLEHAGAIAFVATLSPSDNEYNHLYEEPIGDWSRAFDNRTAEVTPGGQEVLFQSHQSLTGYHNQESEGPAVSEAFVYDAQTGRIACASCNPSGIAPSIRSTGDTALPVPGSGGENIEEFAPRWMSDDGARVFFQTVQPLVPEDTNGRLDVYEWERNGEGTCPAATGGAERGCVYLVSGGQSADESYFVDADAEGANVFFASRGRLTPQAGNENMAMYDARVDGGFPELKTACVGTGCQGVPPAPPIFATPSSVTFSGVGNFEPAASKPAAKAKPKKKSLKCKQRYVAEHGKCVKRKSKKGKRSIRKQRSGKTFVNGRKR